MGFDAWNDRDLAGDDRASPDLEVTAELAPGERVVWSGQPRPGRSILLSLPIALFGILFGGFGLFGIMAASQTNGAGLRPLLALPFVVVGVGMVLSPVWSGWKAKRIRYALTDRRVVLLEPQLGIGTQLRSYGPDALTNIIRNQRGDGSGDLIFEEVQSFNRQGRQRITSRGFMAIDDVRKVEELIRSTLLANRTAP